MVIEMNGRVTIVNPLIKVPSGTKIYVENVLRGLKQEGLSFRQIEIRKREVSFHGKPYFGFISQYLSASFKSADTEIVHSLSPSSIIKGTNIVTVHDIIPLIRKDIYFRTWYDRMAFTRSHERLGNVRTWLLSSEVGKKEVMQNLDIESDRLSVIHMPINHEVFYPSERDPYQHNNKLKLLMVSDYNPRKRIDIIINSLRNNPEIEFYHIGPVNSWVRQQNEYKLLEKNSSNIHLLGRMEPEEMRDYVSHADLFVYLSEAEGFGYPPLEAMACGTKVLVSDLPIFHETMGPLASYCKTAEFSVDTVMKAISEVKPVEALMKHSGTFSVETYARELIRLYETISST